MLFALLIYIRKESMGDIKFHKDLLFLALTFCGLLKFRVKNFPKVLYPIILLAFFNMYRSTAPTVYLHYTMVWAGFLFLGMCLSYEMDKVILRRGFILLGVIQTLYLLANHYFNYIPMFGHAVVFVGGKWVPAASHQLPIPPGALGNPMVSAGGLALLLPFFFSSVAGFVLLPLILYGVWLTNSALAYMALPITIWTWGLTRIRGWGWRLIYLLWTLIGSILSYKVLSNLNFFQDGTRGKMWEIAVKAVTRPIEGHGLGIFKDQFTRIAMTQVDMKNVWAQAHSDYVEIFVAFGLIGLSTLIILLSRMRIRRESWQFLAVMFIFLSQCYGSFPLHISFLTAITIMCYSVTVHTRNP